MLISTVPGSHSRRRLSGAWRATLYAVSILLGLVAWRPAWAGPESALRDYVSAPDPAYAYSHVATIPQAGFTIHLLSLTSQNWRAAGEVDRTLWSHWLAVIVPARVLSTSGALLLAGGNNSPQPPPVGGIEVLIAAQMAMVTGTVVGIVTNLPNQPLGFPDAPLPLDEDALVAYSWDKAMDSGDWNWPVYLPMVKGAVRALDAMQAYAPTVTGLPLQRFVVTGFSKRGAIAWLTAAVDTRVAAVAPGVFDVLNMAPQFEHHFGAYGFYTSVVQDYVHYGVIRRVRAPEGQALLQVVDPYSYRAALGLPKFLINSPGDPFFLPDAQRYYLHDLPGETTSRYVANTDHSLSSSAGVTDALTSLIAWYQQVSFGAPRPQIRASLTSGVLTVQATPTATAARLWRAANPAARDFRREAIGEAWTGSTVPDSGGGTYVATLGAPASGYAAYYLELSYPGVAGVPQTYSTPVYVTPDVEPYPLTEAIADPRGKGYWRHQVQAPLRSPGGAEVDAATLAGYFPVPLFDQYLPDLAAAAAVFAAHGGPVNNARQQCLATRLNLAHGALGWYSRLDLGGAGQRHLWEYYQEAHRAFLAGKAGQAGAICAAINSVDVGGLAGAWRRAVND